MGVKKLLTQGIANEAAELEKAETKKATPETETKPAEKTAKQNSEELENQTTKKESAKENSPKPRNNTKEPAKKDEEKAAPNKGGRPTNKEQGLPSRKQYTLTLKEADYKAFLSKAREEELSFAKFMERAAQEYIKNHNSEE